MIQRHFPAIVVLCVAPISAAASATAQTPSSDSALAAARSRVEASPDDPAAHCDLSTAARRVGEYDVAVEAAKRCVQMAPTVAAYQLVFARALVDKARMDRGLSGLGNARTGLAAAERAVKLDPDFIEARRFLVDYYLEAPSFAGGSRRKAQRQAEEIMRRDPAFAVWAKLRLLKDDAKDEELQAVFEQGLPLIGTAADSSDIVIASVITSVNRINSDVLRERLVARLYAAHPTDPRVRYTRARLWALQGRNLDEAEAIFKDYLALPRRPHRGPPKARAYWLLGRTYEKQGRGPEAVEAYRKAVELDPGFQPARADLQRVEKG